MALNTANMDDCTPKCVAPYGPNEGIAYPCDQPCLNTQIFDSDYYDCIDPSSFTYVRWTGTIQRPSLPPVEFTSGWLLTGSNPSDYWTLQSGAGCFLGTTYIDVWYAADGPRAVGSPIGPIPWRASVKAIKISDFFVYGFSRMGGLGYNGKGNPCSGSFSTGPRINLVDGPSGSVNSITGKWQFSNDQAIVELEWEGNTSGTSPTVP